MLVYRNIETKRSVTTLQCDTHECRRAIVFVAISLRHPACIWFNAYGAISTIEMMRSPPHCLNSAPSFVPNRNRRMGVVVSAKPKKSARPASQSSEHAHLLGTASYRVCESVSHRNRPAQVAR